MSSKNKPSHSQYSDEPRFTIHQAVEITRGPYANHKGVITKVALAFHILLDNGVHVKKFERDLMKFHIGHGEAPVEMDKTLHIFMVTIAYYRALSQGHNVEKPKFILEEYMIDGYLVSPMFSIFEKNGLSTFSIQKCSWGVRALSQIFLAPPQKKNVNIFGVEPQKS